MACKIVLPCIGQCGVLGGEDDADLRVCIARAIPAGQRVRTLWLGALELQQPLAGIRFAGLGGFTLKLRDARDGHELRVANEGE